MDTLGDRMKEYENAYRFYLTKRTPVILRIDGRAFHSFTRGFDKPFDTIFVKAMQETAKALCKNISGCKLAYTQSDEISLLLVDYDTLETQPWFGNNLQKLCSVAASIATLEFNKSFNQLIDYYWEQDLIGNVDKGEKYFDTLLKAAEKGATFDARAFILPKEEVCNYFIWRQKDAVRNSIQSSAQALYPQKELQGKNSNELLDMIVQKTGTHWQEISLEHQRGTCCIKEEYELDGTIRTHWIIDKEIPLFTRNREYIEEYI